MQFQFIQFGQVCDSITLFIDDRPVSETDFSASFWRDFALELAEIWERLICGQTGYVRLAGNFFYGDKGFYPVDENISSLQNAWQDGADLYFAREGELMRIQWRGHVHWMPVALFKKQLQSLVKNICAAHPDVANDEKITALLNGDLSGLDREGSFKLATGLDRYAYRTVYDMLNDIPDERAYAAVARMGSGFLGPDDLAELLRHIARLPASSQEPLPRLQKLVSLIPISIFNGDRKNYDQGYHLATFLRDSLGLAAERSRLDIEAVATSLGLEICEDHFHGPVLALALWHHGVPRIYLNIDEIGDNKNLYRSSIAHELCHILVDRHGARPFGDLLDAGEDKDGVERRARAFAAEFLLPRNWAVDFLNHQQNMGDIHALAGSFGVSQELAANQIINAARTMPVPPEMLAAATEVSQSARMRRLRTHQI